MSLATAEGNGSLLVDPHAVRDANHQGDPSVKSKKGRKCKNRRSRPYLLMVGI